MIADYLKDSETRVYLQKIELSLKASNIILKEIARLVLSWKFVLSLPSV